MSRRIYLDCNASTPIAREAGIVFHTDAAQSVGKIPADVEALRADLLSVAGHEGGRRAGTENVLLAVALGAACDTAKKWVGMPRVRDLRDRFREGIREIFGDGVTRNFVGRAGAEVLAALPGVAASIGSACRAGAVTLSPVLAAMGVPAKEGMGAVRFSLGRATSWEELEEVLGLLQSAIG